MSLFSAALTTENGDKPQPRGAEQAARKDSTLALRLAEHTKIPLFTIQAAHTAYELGMAAGLGRQDYASIATLWEGWTGLPLRDDSDSDGGGGPA